MAYVEDVAKRTRNAKHFYDAVTGKWQAEFTIAHRHYKDDSGNWQDLDETIVDDGQNGFDKKCEKTRHTFRMASGGNRRWYPRRDVLTEYVDITGMQYYDNRWRNLNLPAAVWKAQGAEWDMTNLYASITNTWKRIKADFTLKNSSAYTRLRFAISFTGLTYNSTTGELTSTTDGLVWGTIDKSTALDANEANVVVTQSYDGTYIEWNVDTTGATFPIYVDPTFTDGYGGDVDTAFDTFMYASSEADTNFGTEVVLDVGRNGIDNLRTLMKMDISSIPQDVNCISAILTLYSLVVENPNRPQIAYELRSGRATWGELTATWNRYDGANTWGIAGCSDTSTDRQSLSLATWNFPATQNTAVNISLDTNAVKTWFGSSNANYGFIIQDTIEEDWTREEYYSSDNATTGYRPKLVVDYTAAAGTALGTANITLANYTLSADADTIASAVFNATLANYTLTASGVVATAGSYNPTQDAIVWGEQNPGAGTNAISWATWDNGAGAAGSVSGDADWGKLQLIVGQEARSAVIDIGDASTREYTLNSNAYGTGYGTSSLEIRGSTGTFLQDDASPGWTVYSSPLTRDWRYVQVRENKT